MSYRVLHVGPLPPPYGGVAVMVQSLIDSEPLDIFTNQIFNTSWGTDTELVGKKSLSIRRAIRRVFLSFQLFKYVKDFSPKIIHFQCGSGGTWDFPGDMLMLFAAKKASTKSKIIFHWHRDPALAFFPNKNRLARAFFNRTAGQADLIFVLSKDYQKNLKKTIGTQVKPKVEILPNAFDPLLLTLEQRDHQEKKVRINFIGRLTKEKGVLDIIEVARRIVKTTPNVSFRLAGSPGAGDIDVSKLIELHDLSAHIQIIGPVYGNSKLDFFASGDLLLFPSYRESFGIAALESMAAGLPVVAYSVGAIPSFVIYNKTGFLVKPGDIEGLYQYTQRIIQNKKLRNRMSLACREQVKEFSMSNVASQVRKTYYQLMASS